MLSGRRKEKTLLGRKDGAGQEAQSSLPYLLAQGILKLCLAVLEAAPLPPSEGYKQSLPILSISMPCNMNQRPEWAPQNKNSASYVLSNSVP